MSLDNIELTETLIQSLYSKSLYDLHTNKSDLATIHAGSISFLGSNQKKIVLLVMT